MAGSWLFRGLEGRLTIKRGAGEPAPHLAYSASARQRAWCRLIPWKSAACLIASYDTRSREGAMSGFGRIIPLRSR